MTTTARPGRYNPLGYEDITSLATAVGLTIPDADANCALVQALTQNVRWRDDGTDPDASTGMLLAAGADMWYEGDLNKLKLIETSASAAVNVTFYSDTRPGQ